MACSNARAAAAVHVSMYANPMIHMIAVEHAYVKCMFAYILPDLLDAIGVNGLQRAFRLTLTQSAGRRKAWPFLVVDPRTSFFFPSLEAAVQFNMQDIDVTG
jgi:hypothetical protein